MRGSTQRKVHRLSIALLILILATPVSIRPLHGLPVGGRLYLGSPTPTSVGPVINEIQTPGNSSEPLGLTVDGSGNVWFAEAAYNRIVEYQPASQTFRSFDIPSNPHTAFIWFMFFDKRGSLWFSDATEPFLWRLSPSGGQFEKFSTDGANPFVLAYDPITDRLWFSSTYSGQLGLVQLGSSGARLLKLVSLPLFGETGVGPAGIAFDGKGHLFVAETFAGSIAMFNESDLSQLALWHLGNSSRPVGVAVRGNSIWFTNHASSLFGSLLPADGEVTEIATPLAVSSGSPTISLPYWVAESNSGVLWFDLHFGSSILRFDPQTMLMTNFELNPDSWPLRLTVDDNSGKVWFTEFGSGRIGWIAENSSLIQMHSAPASLFLNRSSVSLTLSKPGDYGQPSVTGSLTTNGQVNSNLSLRIQSTGSDYIITLSSLNIVPGNYTLTVCFSRTLIQQCTTDILIVPPVGSSTQLYELAGGTAAIVVLFSYYFLRLRPALRRKKIRRAIDATARNESSNENKKSPPAH